MAINLVHKKRIVDNYYNCMNINRLPLLIINL
ncbi:MAG: hypothetical protein RL090_308 [Bacteroidota bacterium]|jgi:hypothetical protein